MYHSGMRYHDLPSEDVIEYSELQDYLVHTFAHKSAQNLKLKEKAVIEGNSAFIYWKRTFVSLQSKRHVTINGVELIVFRGSKISSVHEYYEIKETAEKTVQLSAGTNNEKMSKLGLTDFIVRQLSNELMVYLEKEQPYLEPEISLGVVSGHLGYTRNQVSFVINHTLERTFYDLINERRIAHATKKIALLDQRLSILEIGFDAGFNSVSGFYSAFKRQTGMSPAQYRRSLSSIKFSCRSRVEDMPCLLTPL